MQHQTVPLQEEGAAAAGPPPPPVPPPLQQVYNITPSPPLQRQQRYHLDMVAGKAPPLGKFPGDMKNLEGWILQMDNNFTIIQTRNQQQ